MRWIALLFASLVMVSAHAQSVAMVTDVQGRATTQPVSGKPLVLAITTEIAGDATVRLDAGTRLSVLYMVSGDEYQFAGPAQVRFAKTAPQVLSGAPAQKRAAAQAKQVAVRVSGVTQAGLVMRGGSGTGRLQLLSPVGSRILGVAPQFRWKPMPMAAAYRFRLTNQLGQLLHETEVQGTDYQLPAGVVLAEGASYTWEVLARSPDGRGEAGISSFSLAPAALATEAAALRPGNDAAVAERVLYASWLELQLLRDEARRQWQALLADRPDDPGLLAMAGQLQHAPRSVADITSLLDQYQPDPAQVAEHRAVLARDLPAGAGALAQQNFYLKRAYAAQALGLVASQLADLRRAAALVRGSEDEWPITRDIFLAEISAGNFANALKLNEQTISMVGSIRGRLPAVYSAASWMYTVSGDMAGARAALRNIEAVMNGLSRAPAWHRHGNTWVSHLEQARANVLEGEGRYEEAEASRRKSLAAAERALAENPAPDSNDLASPERVHTLVHIAQQRLAKNLTEQGRFAEAELLMRGVIQGQLMRLGRYSPAVAGSLARFVVLLNEQGRYRDGESMARASIDIHKVIGSAPSALSQVVARRQLGASLVMQSRWQEALAEFEALRADLAQDAAASALYRQGFATYRAIALIKNGRAQDAVTLLEPALAASMERLGSGNYELAEQRGLLALALAEAGQRQRALAEYAEAAKGLLARAQEAGEGEGGAPARAWRLSLILEGYIRLLHDMRQDLVPQRTGFDAAAEAFRLADAVRGQGTQRALSASAARAATSDPALAGMIRKEQDARQQTGVLYGTLLRLVSAPPDQQLPQVIAQMRGRIAELEREQRTLSADLLRRFPAYANLISPQPASVSEARTALREGEVLLSLLTTDERTYVWAIPKSGVVLFHAVPLGAKAAAEAVAVLRKALDVGRVTLDAVPDFDVAAAHRLYTALLQPVAGAWQGAHTLMVVANGPLAQLPLGLLPTAAAVPGADAGSRFSRYQTVPWLLKQLAVTQLPAVNTLVTLRRLPAGDSRRAMFAGFGDPQFGPQLVTAPSTDQLSLRMRSAALPQAGTEQWIPYSSLAPLPDTREEILAIAKTMNADRQKDVFLGAAASRQNVRSMDLSGRRIIAFATHGLIPGDFPNLDQPALALAASGGSAEEGLLTLEDILGLKLDADWVVLSACNTAAGDGAGAEAISGLGRGFFYAGSRALLVTHWPVETGSARELVTGLFTRYAADGKMSRAEALRQASLATMGGGGRDGGGREFSYAHPLFWSPYALVGDGGR